MWLTDYIAQSASTHWRVGWRAQEIGHKPILDVSGEAVVDYIYDPDAHRDIGVLNLPDAVVMGTHGWILTHDDVFLIDTNHWAWEPERTPCFGWHKRIGKRTLKGTTVSLLSWCGSTNLYHWLIECMPRLAILEKCGCNLNDVDHILVPATTLASMRKLFEHFRLPADKIVVPGFFEIINCENLIATSHPGAPRHAPSWAVNYLRSCCQTKPSRIGRRLFLARGGARRDIENHRELWTMLHDLGFELFDYESHLDELMPFAEASIVVGAHGAGLSRLFACRENTVIIELLSRNWRLPFFKNLSLSAGLSYHCCLGTPTGREAHSSFSVNVASLHSFLERTIAEKGLL